MTRSSNSDVLSTLHPYTSPSHLQLALPGELPVSPWAGSGRLDHQGDGGGAVVAPPPDLEHSSGRPVRPVNPVIKDCHPVGFMP